MKKSTKNLINIGLLIVMFVALYFIEKVAGTRSMLITVLKKGAIYALIAVSMNLLNGFTGLFSLGQAGFMLVGAYTYAVLTIPMAKRMAVYQYYDGGIIGFTVPAIVGILAAGALAAILAALIGLPVLRLKSDYLAIATLGFAEIIRAIIQWDALGPVTNGSNLLKTYPTFSTVLQPFLAATICIGIAAEAMGINLFHHKQMSFVISSFFAGVGGALLAMYQASLQANAFKSSMTYEILLIVVIGGMGSITGSVLASFLFIACSEWWLRFLDTEMFLFGGTFKVPLLRSGFRMVVFSIVIMIVVLFFRKGIMGERELWDLFKRKKNKKTEGAKG